MKISIVQNYIEKVLLELNLTNHAYCITIVETSFSLKLLQLLSDLWERSFKSYVFSVL